VYLASGVAWLASLPSAQEVAVALTVISFAGLVAVAERLIIAAHLPAQNCQRGAVDVKRLLAVAAALLAVEAAVALNGAVKFGAFVPHTIGTVVAVNAAIALAGLILLIKKRCRREDVKDYMSGWVTAVVITYVELARGYKAYENELLAIVLFISSLFMAAVVVASAIMIAANSQETYGE